MRRSRILIVFAVVLGVLGWLLYGGLEKNVVFFLTPQELYAKGADGVGVPVRLGCQVKPGSVVWDAQTLKLQFQITDGAKEVEVHANGAPPQMFRENMGVVVEGRMGADHVFNASNLLVKHSNEYRAPKAGDHPGDLSRTLIKPGAP